jgi:uncharacterized protein (TIGR02118 family)
MKSICALARRPDLSRGDFATYYENSHAPLALGYFPFRGYVRNHLLDNPHIGFDTVSEFWADDLAAMTGILEGPAGAIISEDERRFMDQSRKAPGGAEEQMLSDGPPADSQGIRTAALVNWPGDDGAARADLLAWGREIATDQSGVSVDFVQSWSEPAVPARAVLWAPGLVGKPPSTLDARILRVHRIETNRSALLL